MEGIDDSQMYSSSMSVEGALRSRPDYRGGLLV